jgi:hypothetical protein
MDGYMIDIVQGDKKHGTSEKQRRAVVAATICCRSPPGQGKTRTGDEEQHGAGDHRRIIACPRHRGPP